MPSAVVYADTDPNASHYINNVSGWYSALDPYGIVRVSSSAAGNECRTFYKFRTASLGIPTNAIISGVKLVTVVVLQAYDGNATGGVYMGYGQLFTSAPVTDWTNTGTYFNGWDFRKPPEISFAINFVMPSVAININGDTDISIYAYTPDGGGNPYTAEIYFETTYTRLEFSWNLPPVGCSPLQLMVGN
jgi:hypothetical protein